MPKGELFIKVNTKMNFYGDNSSRYYLSNGVFTQMDNGEWPTEQDALNQQILESLRGMQTATSVTGTGSDIFNRLGYTNEYLRAIRDSNEAMIAQFRNILGRIDSKLARL